MSHTCIHQNRRRLYTTVSRLQARASPRSFPMPLAVVLHLGRSRPPKVSLAVRLDRSPGPPGPGGGADPAEGGRQASRLAPALTPHLSRDASISGVGARRSALYVVLVSAGLASGFFRGCGATRAALVADLRSGRFRDPPDNLRPGHGFSRASALPASGQVLFGGPSGAASTSRLRIRALRAHFQSNFFNDPRSGHWTTTLPLLASIPVKSSLRCPPPGPNKDMLCW